MTFRSSMGFYKRWVHHFSPATGEAISSSILKQILAEGRKFGVGVGLVSQRPGKLDTDALSQCNTQCLLRIINPLDQNKVRESVEAVGQAIINELPGRGSTPRCYARCVPVTPPTVRRILPLPRYGSST